MSDNPWKENAQANAAAINTIYEYVGTHFGNLPSQEHLLGEYGPDPVGVCGCIIQRLEEVRQKYIICDVCDLGV